MRDVWPSSIPAAVNYEKKRLEDLDPRFKVSISQSDGIINYGIRAKEKVDCKLHFKNPEQFQKGFRDFVDRGLPFTLDTTNIIKVEGSELIREAFEKSFPGKLTFAPERKFEAICIISVLNELNEEKLLLYEIKGIMEGGWKEARFQGGLDGTPFRVNLVCDFTKQKPNEMIHFEIIFKEYQIWKGFSVITLPFFDKIFSLFSSMRNGNTIKIRIEIKGNILLEGKIKPNKIETLNYILYYLNIIKMVRDISHKLNIELNMPNIELMSSDEVDTIEFVYNILCKDCFRQKGTIINYTATLAPSENYNDNLDKNDSMKLWPGIRIEVEESKYIIFGKEINLGTLQHTLTNAKVIKDDDNKIKLLGTEKSELIIKKI